MTWLIEFDFGSGWEDWTGSFKENAITRTMEDHHSLQSTTNTCSLKVGEDPLFFNKIFGSTDEIQARVTRDGTPYFTGWVLREGNADLDIGLNELKLELVDPSWSLKRQTIRTPIVYENRSVDYIVADLLGRGGISSLTSPGLTTVIDYLVIGSEDKVSYFDMVSGLLEQYGSVITFDESGSAIIKKGIYDSTPTQQAIYSTGGNGNIFGKLKISKKARRYDGVRIKWFPRRLLADQLVFSDSTGRQGIVKADIYLPDFGGIYPPREEADAPSYAEYQIDDREIVMVKNAALDWSYTGSVTLDEFTPEPKRARIKFTGSGTITKLDIKGDAIVKESISVAASYIPGRSHQNIEEIDADYICSSEDAQFLSAGRKRYWENCSIEYEFKVREDITPGTVLSLQEVTRLGIDMLVAVSRVREDWEAIDPETGAPYRIITCEAITTYQAEAVETEYAYEVPPPDSTTQIVEEAVEDLVSYDDLEQGYSNPVSGMTTEPVDVGGFSAVPFGTGAISLSWNIQANLTNPDIVEIQVCDRNDEFSQWRALLLDGTHWGGIVGETTEVPDRLKGFIHPNIPSVGALPGEEEYAEDPQPRPLHYRIRRVTKVGLASPSWVYASSVTSLIPSEWIAAGSIAANKLVAGLLNSLLASFGSIEVLEGGGQAFNVSPLARLVISPYAIIWETRPEEASPWQSRRMIGDPHQDEVLADIVRMRGLFPLDRSFDFSIGYTRPAGALTYGFDGSLLDHNGANGLSAEEPIDFVDGRFGPANEGAVGGSGAAAYAGQLSGTFPRQTEQSWTIAGWLRDSGAPQEPIISAWEHNELHPELPILIGGIASTYEVLFDQDDRLFCGSTETDNPILILSKDTNGYYNIVDQEITFSNGDGTTALALSADDQYLIAGGGNAPYLYALKKSGTVYSHLAPISGAPASYCRGLAITADSVYFAATFDVSPYAQVYKRTGDDFSHLTDLSGIPGDAQSAAFSPDGIYLVITHNGANAASIYKRSGDTFTKLTFTNSYYHGFAVAFDGTYLFIAANANKPIYKRTGDTFTEIANIGSLWSNGYPYRAAFSSDSKYLAVTNRYEPRVALIRRKGDTFTPFTVMPSYYTSESYRAVAFSKNDKYLAVGTGYARPAFVYESETTNWWENTTELEVPRLIQLGEPSGDKVGIYRKPEGLILAEEDSPNITTAISFPTDQWNFVAIRNNGSSVTLMVNTQTETLSLTLDGTTNIEVILRLLIENGMRMDDLIFYPGALTDQELASYRDSGYPWADATFGDTFVGSSPGRLIRFMDEVVFEKGLTTGTLDSDSINLKRRTSDPPSPVPGQFWFREDL